MLELVKLALRLSSTDFDTEVQLYIDACLREMTDMGVIGAKTNTSDPQIKETVVAYCKWKFGNNADKDDWESIYHMKLAQLTLSSGHTQW